jgi:aspartate dehydrogenase
LALAGIGFDRTEVEVVAEGGLPGFVAEVEVDAECVSLRFSSQSLPSLTSPRTSQIVGPSVIAAIRSLVDPIRVGS